jgi:hypothetical protein
MRYFCVRIGERLGTASTPFRRVHAQNFLAIFFVAPLQTPPPRSGKQKGKEILRCDGASVLQKLRKVIMFPKLCFLRPLCRTEARVYRARSSSSVRSHFAITSHCPLTFVCVDCSVLLVFTWWLRIQNSKKPPLAVFCW